MKIEDFQPEFAALPGAAPVWHGTLDPGRLRPLCQDVRSAGGRLVALWGSQGGGPSFALHVAVAVQQGLAVASLPLEREGPAFPDISDIFPAAGRMQRAVADLLGFQAAHAADRRPWLRHGHWPADRFPLSKEFDGTRAFPPEGDTYPFVAVEGEGVHEIPVGPVHAGTIEPGHFRFSVVGEKVLRLEQRLGYTHKGIEKLFEAMTVEQGARLAGRISGDSTVAYAWAYAMAAEGVSGSTPPPRALWLRALFLERERIMNHLGDLGALGNDAGLAFALAQFSRLKEDVLRTNQALFGHRYLMDAIVPGGVAHDVDFRGFSRIIEEITELEREVPRLKRIFEDHAGLQDRFLTTGRVKPDLAARLGLAGLAGRASGQSWDLRAQFPCAPYDGLEVRMATHRGGDVAARVTVRFEELTESMRLCRILLRKMPEGETSTPLNPMQPAGLGIGWVEGWRGEVLLALHTGEDGALRRVHPHDPSWHNWPVLEHAVIGNIVPDFPLINKSFNLSYSGHDL